MQLVGPIKINPFSTGQNVKRIGFYCLLKKSASKVIYFIVQLSEVLCDHLETALSVFQTKAAENDGVAIDAQNISSCSPQDIDLTASFDLLLKYLTSITAGKELIATDNIFIFFHIIYIFPVNLIMRMTLSIYLLKRNLGAEKPLRIICLSL